uniref:NADH-plastoquinone oxidoreductase subunit 7 n=1 Tax=Commiphora gileadensis TaxID=1700993 RepID=A0A410PAD9_9ROSI|nr:NADH-plastoquinone oxidoreductase subunit 7 [Commiphora gileadensis]QAT19756.1 NADH-plastoquinone oxidoreductase subunit 7 [Commiphora gileadensis]
MVYKLQEKTLWKSIWDLTTHQCTVFFVSSLRKMVKMLLTVNQYWVIYTEGWKKLRKTEQLYNICRMKHVGIIYLLCSQKQKLQMDQNSWEIFKYLKGPAISEKLCWSRVVKLLIFYGLALLWQILVHRPLSSIFSEKENKYMIYSKLPPVRERCIIIFVSEEKRLIYLMAGKINVWISAIIFKQGLLNIKNLLHETLFFLERVEGVGIIGGEEAINWGLSGPMLRASGLEWDLRKVDHYECYDEFDWEVQWQKEGDSLARYLVRMGEMTESIKIIQQALEGIPGGPYENLEIRCFDRESDPEWNDFEDRFISKKPSPSFELPKQELYVRVEAPKGELGIFLIGDQSGFPWRWKIRPPGFINLQILPQLVKRMKLADIMTILGSIDIIMGEVDR